MDWVQAIDLWFCSLIGNGKSQVVNDQVIINVSEGKAFFALMLGVSRALEHGLEHVPEQVFRETQSWPGFAVAEPSPVLGDVQAVLGPQ